MCSGLRNGHVCRVQVLEGAQPSEPADMQARARASAQAEAMAQARTQLLKWAQQSPAEGQNSSIKVCANPKRVVALLGRLACRITR
jgi:hypothetical protein